MKIKTWNLRQLVGGVVNECEAGNIFVAGEGCVPGNQDTCERDVIVEPPNLDQICEGVNLGVFPNPNSCTSYILCVFNAGEIVQCQPNTPVFDIDRGVCVEGD